MRLRSRILGSLLVLGGSVVLGVGAACSSEPPAPLLATYGFEEGLEGWESRASLAPGDQGWGVQQESPSSLSNKGAAVFTVDADQGNGAIWLQKTVPISAEEMNKDADVDVEMSFTVWVEETPPTGTQVIFWAKRSAPLDKGSFIRKEPLTSSAAGTKYRFTESQVSTSGGTVWLALGLETVQGTPLAVHFGDVDVQVTA